MCDKDGKYSQVAIYRNKKSAEPLAVLGDEFVENVVDEIIKDDKPIKANRHMRLIEIAEDGSFVKLWFS